MTADGNGMMTSNNNPPPNSSAVITGAQRWSPFQNDAGPAGFSIGLPQQQQQGGSRSTVVSGFGVYSNPSSRTVTTSHMGSVQLTNAAGNGSEALPPTESHRTNFQALMSKLAGFMPVDESNTASDAFDYNDPNNRVNQILKGMDGFNPSTAAAAAALGAGEGNNDINLPFTSGSLDKHQTGTTLIEIAGAGVEKKVEEQVNAVEKEKEGGDDQRGTLADAGDHNGGGKAYELRNRKVRLPKELLSNEEAAQEAEKNQKDGSGGEGADVDFRKVVDQFDQSGGASTDEDDDDEFDDEFNEADAEEEEQLRKGSGGRKGRKGARRSGGCVPQKPSPATTASGGSGAKKQQQRGLHNDAQAHLQAQQQGRVITSNDNASGGSHGAAVARPSVLPHGQVGRPRNYAGDPELNTLGEEDRRRLKRRIANRESARRVRQKRQEMIDEMQIKITALSHQNARVLAAFANSEQQRQSLQNNLAIVSERFAIKLQEDNEIFMEHAAMRWALQLHGINLNDVVADYAKHNEQQRQKINGGNNIENGNYNTTITNPAAAALATRACSLLQRPGSGGAGNGASAFNSTQPMFSAFSAPMNITQPATSAAAAAAAAAAATAAMLPPVTTAGMAPTLNGYNMN